MTWSGLPSPPSGWQRSVLRDKDSLASLAKETGLAATLIAENNGVHFPGARTCAWGNDVGDMVEGTKPVGANVIVGGGSKRDRSKCGRDCAFVAGSVINLPVGVRQPAGLVKVPAPPATTQASSGGGGVLAAVLALLGLLATAATSTPTKKTAKPAA